MMRKRDYFLIFCMGLAVIWGAWLLLFWAQQEEPVAAARKAGPEVAVMQPVEGDGEPAEDRAPRPRMDTPKDTGGKGASSREASHEPDVAIQYPDGLEGIKQRIYDINVEYLEDLEKLDALGHVTDQPPEVLWDGTWASADDWKRRPDGFRIEQREDGSYAFYPDKDSSRSYAWDEEKGEFAWDRDYYGKIISHKARFIEEDVLVLMTISGRKVALDIYRKNE